MSKVVINNVSLELDLMDADVMETYQNALKTTVDEANKIMELSKAKAIPSHESMRRQCRLVEDFADRMFGAGTAEKIFPRKNHLGDHLEAFSAICHQADEISEQANRIIANDKYSPNRLNREQRRKQQRDNRPSNFRPAQ